jgi:hypothetical protein
MGLKRWLMRLLSRFFVESPAPPPDEKHNHYRSLTRYIYQSGHYSATKPKIGAFLPPKDKSTISAAWIDDLHDLQIWQIGDILGTLRPTPVEAKARADFDSGILSRENLTIEPDPVPHPRHVNLAGWPAEKDAQKNVALGLIAGSRLRVR